MRHEIVLVEARGAGGEPVGIDDFTVDDTTS
jgi:hypothetical protein